MPTGIWSSRLRSGSAHCDLEVAVEVRQCPLGSGARGGGPAVPTGIWSGGPAVPTGIWTARRRRRRRRWRRRMRRRRRRRTALIKSNNPHLAGGEKSLISLNESLHRNPIQFDSISLSIYIYIHMCVCFRTKTRQFAFDSLG